MTKDARSSGAANAAPSPTVAQRVLTACNAVISGRLAVVRKPGYCLMFTRQVYEAALGFTDGGFYRRFIVAKVAPKHDGYWARDAQLSLRQLGYAVPLSDLKPGDIVFNHEVSKPYGHVGIYMGSVTVGPKGRQVTIRQAVIENTDSARGYRLGGAVAITPLGQWGALEAIRIPESAVRKVF